MKKKRTTPYEADCTRGQSLINPMTYKGDVLVQVWMDSRSLATIMKWMDKNGMQPRFMSQVVRRPFEVLAAHVVENEGCECIDDTATARFMLEDRFQVNLNRGNKGLKNVVHNKVLSTNGPSLGDRLGDVNYEVGNVQPKEKLSQEEAVAKYRKEKALEAMKAMEDHERKEQDEEVARQLAAAKESNLCVKEEEVNVRGAQEGIDTNTNTDTDTDINAGSVPGAGIKEGMSVEELIKYNRERDAVRIAAEEKEEEELLDRLKNKRTNGTTE